MTPFPTDLLRPRLGSLWRHRLGIAIEVPLRPFKLVVYPENEELEVDTVLRLDFVNLPTIELLPLSGRTFSFPRNPEEGYIDGSIYICGLHHPAEVTAIRFGSLTPAGLEAEFTVDLEFEYNGLGDFSDTPWRFRTYLRRE